MFFIAKDQLATYIIAECLSMRHINLRGRRVPTVEYALYYCYYALQWLKYTDN